MNAPTAAQRRAWRLVNDLLGRIEHGTIRLTAPDGDERTYGGASDSDQRTVGGGAPDSDPRTGGALTSHLDVHDWSFFGALIHGGSPGIGQSYIDGHWDADDLVALVRIVIANRSALQQFTTPMLARAIADRVAHTARGNRRAQARRNIAAHYDLSNEMYETFLDSSMTYSSAMFPEPAMTLEAAQTAKHEAIARKARLAPGLHVLEIGCGWGGFAIHAARVHGCRVTGITLSEAQATWARRRVAEEGLGDLVDIRVVDYRDLDERFDRIVSIEMLEAVGRRYLGTYFAAVDRLMADDGLAVVQVISIPAQRERAYRRRPDFIQTHVFPGGYLPSLASMTRAMTRSSNLMVDRVDDIAADYAETLRRWRQRFLGRVDEVRALGFDEQFVRLWVFYLAYCEAAFASRYIQDLQLVLTRTSNPTLGLGAYAASDLLTSDRELS
jgi:cyclopropane-fatty-acyl-phospholipid synthase